jgi:aldehyde dehydrogenase (NAD+)
MSADIDDTLESGFQAPLYDPMSEKNIVREEHFAPDVERLTRLFESQKSLARGGERVSYERRRRSIIALRDAMFRHRQEIRDALHADLRKPAAEADLTEIYAVVAEARHALRGLRRWMKPKRVATPLALLGSRSRIEYEPKGVVLIISPWNFPFNLTFGPLVSALAAGNRVMLKPSELTPDSSAMMSRIVASIFDESEVAVVEGGRETATALLQLPFDHIFFTGSPQVGRIVMRAAAEHLTSVTLELGGKSPVIVDESADVAEAAKKVAWGKSINSGQICIAPDYVMVHERVHEEFIAAFRREVNGFFGDDPVLSRDYSRIVNSAHYERIHGLLRDATERGATAHSDPQPHASSRFIPPTLISNVVAGSRIHAEEIFGPLLPVETFRDLDEALARIRSGEKPLVLYAFSRDRRRVRQILDATSSGAAVVNDTLLHFYQHNLPFGGVGFSGMGKGHGKHGFEAFSNARAVFSQPTRFSVMQLLYPPYTAWKQKLIDWTLRWF